MKLRDESNINHHKNSDFLVFSCFLTVWVDSKGSFRVEFPSQEPFDPVQIAKKQLNL